MTGNPMARDPKGGLDEHVARVPKATAPSGSLHTTGIREERIENGGMP